MKKKLIITILVLTTLVITTGSISYFWYQNAVNEPASNSSEIIQKEVEQGESFLDLAQYLLENEALTDTNALRLYLRFENLEPQIQAGTYIIPRNLNFPQLIQLIESGPKSFTFSVTIPEGLRADEVAQILSKAYSTAEVDFSSIEFMQIVNNPKKYTFTSEVQSFLDTYKPSNKPLEGFLFPDTYVIGLDAAPQDVIELMISTLMSRLDQNELNPADPGRLKNFYEILTLSTVVEREANNLKDMKIVADIFLRRMEQGWVLGADAPLLYPIKNWAHELTITEIADVSNPYNTRQRQGLPPTPIANPGIDAINAVLNPKNNQYFFFISAGGKNYYATTSAGHDQNIAKYLN